jgi:hypothetical protein
VPIHTALAGSKVFLVTACDNAGNETAELVAYDVRYGCSGILQPINADGSSIFKLARTVPVKFRLTDATGAYMGGTVARIYVARIGSDVVGDEAEAVSTAAATEGNLFRYDSAVSQYVFNLGSGPTRR